MCNIGDRVYWVGQAANLCSGVVVNAKYIGGEPHQIVVDTGDDLLVFYQGLSCPVFYASADEAINGFRESFRQIRNLIRQRVAACGEDHLASACREIVSEFDAQKSDA